VVGIDASGAMPIEMSSEREKKEENEGKESERDFRGWRTTVSLLALFVVGLSHGSKHTKRKGGNGQARSMFLLESLRQCTSYATSWKGMLFG
jgi:hypothetical protein